MMLLTSQILSALPTLYFFKGLRFFQLIFILSSAKSLFLPPELAFWAAACA